MKIYVHVIEGSDCWMVVEAKQLTKGEFEIIEFDEFDPKDNSIIPQYILGDVVNIRKHSSGENEFWVADNLIRPSKHEDKKYFEFLYRIVTGHKPKDAIERYQFRHVITRIRKEINNGEIYYPAVKNYVLGVETKKK